MKLLAAFCLTCLALCAGQVEPESPLPARLQQEAVEYAQAQSKSSAGQYVIRSTKLPMLPRLKQGVEIQFEPSHLSKREPTGAFFAVFKVMAEGRLVGSARVELEGRWTGNLLKTTESLGRKTVPTEAQLESVPFEGNPPPGALTEFPVGFRLRANMPAGRTLTQADLEPIPLVNAGERVRLTIRSGCMVISADATARGPGTLGDKVRVELPSRKWVQAVVTGSGEASADWGT
jgi:flagella basal body P-ring formation protein FlgA